MINVPIVIMLTASLYFAETPIKKEREMISSSQLREMIVEVLDDAPRNILFSETAVELLMLTAATESKLGTYYKQINGPALGIMQMEPQTAYDIYLNFLNFQRNSDLLLWIEEIRGNQGIKRALKYNIEYQIAMTRIHYWRVKSPLPNNEAKELADYWKRYYNTSLGKGTVNKAIADYENYAFNNM